MYKKVNYKDYSCSKLLEYLDQLYHNGIDSINYAYIVTDMKYDLTINGLIKSYNKVLKRLVSYNQNCEAGNLYVFDKWLNDNILPSYIKDYWMSLNAFLNENLKRLFFIDFSDKHALKCIANLREAKNYNSILKHLLRYSSSNVSAIVKEKVLPALVIVNEAPNHLSSHFNTTTGDYNNYRMKYIENMKYLLSKGYIKSYKDVFFEDKTMIHYFYLSKRQIISSFIVTIIGLTMLALLLYNYVAIKNYLINVVEWEFIMLKLLLSVLASALTIVLCFYEDIKNLIKGREASFKKGELFIFFVVLSVIIFIVISVIPYIGYLLLLIPITLAAISLI